MALSTTSQSIDRRSMLENVKPYLAKDWVIQNETEDHFTIEKK